MSITTYIQETREELRRVTWLTRKQALMYTILVIVISGVLGYLLGFFDFIFSSGLTKLLEK
jgi:preprotein translocase SecE subunit